MAVNVVIQFSLLKTFLLLIIKILCFRQIEYIHLTNTQRNFEFYFRNECFMNYEIIGCT